MKNRKIVLCLLIFPMFAISVTAMEFDMELSFDTPFEVDTYKEGSGGFYAGPSFSLNTMFNENFGLSNDIGLYLSQVCLHQITSNAYNKTNDTYEYVDLPIGSLFNGGVFFESKLFIGPIIRPIKKEKYFIDITPGLEFNDIPILFYNNSNSYKKQTFNIFQMGIGFDLRLSYKLNKYIYLNFGLYNSYNFLQTINGKMIKNNGEELVIKEVTPILKYRLAPRCGISFFL